MSRRGFTLVELLVALVLLGVAVLGLLATLSQAARAERERLRARTMRARTMEAHERGVASRSAGWTLVELLVVLVLGGVVVGAVAAAAHGAGHRRAGRGVEARAIARRLDEAADLLAGVLREGVAPRLEGDSVLMADRVLGLALGCAPSVVATPEGDWRATVRAGDTWHVWRPATGWESRRAVGGRAAACPGGVTGWQPDGAPAFGHADVVAVTRPGRWTAYRDAERRGQLGLREAHAAGWDVVQPIVGPLDGLRFALAPHDSGWRLAVTTGEGTARREVWRVVQPRNP